MRWIGAPAARRPCARARTRLLLLEPDADVAALVATILTDEGYAVDHVAGPDALGAYLARHGPAACALVLSAPYADPWRAPYAWLDTLRARVRSPIAICARYPAMFYADHRAGLRRLPGGALRPRGSRRPGRRPVPGAAGAGAHGWGRWRD